MERECIHVLPGGPVLDYAAEQLRYYLGRISSIEYSLERYSAYKDSVPGVWVGIDKAFPEQLPLRQTTSDMDDVVYICSAGSEGLILAGSNERSILYAVYAFLERLGVSWVRPGEDGEIVPQRERIDLSGFEIVEAASYRYRGVCIEGGLAIEHGIAMIDYMAKKRFNTYFIQFQDAYQFWSRWYDRHNEQPLLAKSDARRYTQQLIAEIKKRGLALQMVGHGWTNECLGVAGDGWFQTDEVLPPGKRELLAEVDGRRDWWGGIPLNTELCLSNETAFETLVNYVVDYAADHREIDFLHVWMSDGSNNRCECTHCRQRLPSDWYVDVLNAIDEKMTDRGIDMRVVFLVYVDLLWAPQEARITNPDRFVLMFAPISRTYRNALLDHAECDEQMVEFRLNQNQFPKSTAVNIQYLKQWQAMFPGDGFTYDYHLLWKHSMVEPTGLYISEVLHRDIVDTEKIGLQGMVNCQVQRYWFPTGVAMEVSGQTLWDKTRSFEDIKKRYFAAAFGACGGEIQWRLEKLSALLDADILFENDGRAAQGDPAYAGDLADAEALLKETMSEVDRFFHDPDMGEDAIKVSLEILTLGLRYMEKLLVGFQHLAAGDPSQAADAYKAAGDFLMEHEDEIHTVCDAAMWKTWLATRM